jgi:ABC-type polysaccharide/polyol phosphate transport system ATPase subunit
MNLDERHVFGLHGNYRIDLVSEPKNRVAVRFKDVTKRYRIYTSDGQKFLMMFSKRMRRNIPIETYLQKLTISVKKGEYINICGSYDKPRKTLCDLLMGIIYPDFGHLWINGVVASIKAMKSGFVTHLSAEENIRRMCKLKQMNQTETDSLLERILDFADITEINAKLPMKKTTPKIIRRLKAAYYLHVPCDILIMDEALPKVSDEYTQRCDDRMKDLLDQKAICVIRHTKAPILDSKFVTRTLLFGEAKPVWDGDAENAFEIYEKVEEKLLEAENAAE